jgi:hypothetical protein
LPGTHNPWGLGFGTLAVGFWLGFVFHIGFESGFAGFLDFQDGISVDIYKGLSGWTDYPENLLIRQILIQTMKYNGSGK